MIKDFKRVISLILVVAMLAGFAGIPGIADYVPTIEAQAADEKPRTTELPAITLTSKPNGSYQGENLVKKLDVPSVLYKSGNAIVKSVGGGTFNTVLKVTVPGACYDPDRDMNGDGVCNDAYVRLNIIDMNENILKVYSLGGGLDPYPNGLKDTAGNVIYPAVSADSQTGSAAPSGSDWEISFDLAGETNIITDGSNQMLCYRIDYIVPYDYMNATKGYRDAAQTEPYDADQKIYFSELGIDKVERIMFSQFAASAVKTVPTFKLSMTEIIRSYHAGGESDSVDQGRQQQMVFYQNLNFSNVLATNGLDLTLRYSNGNTGGKATWYNGTGSFKLTYSIASTDTIAKGGMPYHDAYTLSVRSYPDKTDYSELKKSGDNTPGYALGNNYGKISGSTVQIHPGALIYVDKYYVTNSLLSTVSIPLYSEQPTLNDNDWGKNAGYNDDATDKYYTVPNLNWCFYHITSDSYATNHWTYNTLDSGEKDFKKDSESLLTFSSDSFINWSSASGKNTVNINLAAGFFNGKSKLVQMVNQTYEGSVTERFYYDYHFQSQLVDRTSSHNLIDAAVSKNYIKAEMSTSWWNSYRTNVIKAYYNLGVLNTDAPYTVDSSCMTNLEFLGANYSGLKEALTKYNPSYERGHLDNVSGQAENQVWIQHGDAWMSLKNNNATGANYYMTMADLGQTTAALGSWEYFVAVRNQAVKMMYACFRSHPDGYSYNKIEYFGANAAGVIQGGGESAMYFVMQYEMEQVAKELQRAKEALVLKTADYNGMADAINNATNNGETQNIVNNNNGTYKYEPTEVTVGSDNKPVYANNILLFKVQSNANEYSGLYYDANGKAFNVVAGETFVGQNNFTNASAEALRKALQNRMDVYDWTGVSNNLENEDLEFNYAGFDPTTTSFTFGTDKATAANENSLKNDGPEKYYLSIAYQNAVTAAINGINTAAQNLRLIVQPKALGTLIEAAKYSEVDDGAGGKLLHRDINQNVNTQYTTTSWNAYDRQMGILVQVLKADDQQSLNWNVNYANANPNYVDTEPDYPTNDPIYSELEVVNSEGTVVKVYPTNRQEEYNYAVESAKNVEKLLKNYANYTELLKRVNGNVYIPEFDNGGSAGLTDGGAKWYTEETWSKFVAARNALTALTNQGGNYDVNTGLANGGVGSYIRGNEFDQNVLDTAVDAFDDALEALQLQKVPTHTWNDKSGSDAILGEMNRLIQNLSELKFTYTTLDASDNLIEVTAPCVDTAEAEAARDAVTAFVSDYADKGLAAVYTTKEDGTVVRYYEKYNELLATFTTIVNSSKGAASYKTEGWDKILARLSGLAGATVTTAGLTGIFDELFVDTKAGTADSYKTALKAIADGYAAATAAAGTYEKQDEIDGYIESLYNFLTTTSLPSLQIKNAIADARTEMAKTFVVYNPYDFKKYEYPRTTDLAQGEVDYSNPLYIWGDDSATVEANKHNGLSAVSVYGDMSDESYAEMVDYLNTAEEGNAGYSLWSAKAIELEKIANDLRVQAGLLVPDENTNYTEGTTKVLEESKVKLDVFLGALNAANRAASYVQNVTAVNPEEDGENHSYGKFTSESVQEIWGVVQYAINYLTTGDDPIAAYDEATHTFTAIASSDRQLEVDKLVFFILDEIENDSADRRLLAKDPTAYHFTWVYTYDENDPDVCIKAVPTLDETAFTGDYSWENLLHKMIESEGLDNGFVLAPAYYGFVDQQINTPYSDALTIDKSLLTLTADGKVDYTNAENITKLTGIVWIRDTKGTEDTIDDTLELVSNGGQQTGADIFEGESWAAYTTALSNAQNINRNYLSNVQNYSTVSTGEDDPAEDFDGPDKVAKDLYTARVNLKLRNFTANPEHKVAVAFADAFRAIVDATVAVSYYTLVSATADDGTVTITPTPQSVNVDPYTYAVDKAALITEIQLFIAMYVDNTDKTAGYNDVQQMRDAAAEIQAKLDQCTLKTLDNDEFKVGYNSLVGSEDSAGFIAGKYTPGTFDGAVYSGGEYDSDIIAKSSVKSSWDTSTAKLDETVTEYYTLNDSTGEYEWVAQSQGFLLNQKLDALYENFSNIEFEDDKDADGKVTKSSLEKLKEAVLAINSDALDLYNYTTGNGNYGEVYAKNLQFAVDMQFNELYNMLRMQVGVGDTTTADLSFYYGDAETEYNNKTYSAKYYVFNQRQVQQYIRNNIESIFEDAENKYWPRIYQVDRLASTSATSTAVASVTGFTYDTADKAYIYSAENKVLDTDTANKISYILSLVASRSGNYSAVFADQYLNNYMTDHTIWLDSNTLYTVNSTGAENNGYVYVLADAKAAEGDKPVAYDMVKTDAGAGWYTSGYGYDIDGKQYYLFAGDAEKAPITGSNRGGWFNDGTCDDVTSQKDDLFNISKFVISGEDKFTSETPVIKLANTIPGQQRGTKSSKYYVTQITNGGWTPSNNNNLQSNFNTEQNEIDKKVVNYYTALRNLVLLPATDAYREVLDLYFEANGQTVTYSDGLNFDISDGKVPAIFYHKLLEGETESNNAFANLQGDAEKVYNGKDTASGYVWGYTNLLPGKYVKTDAAWKEFEYKYSDLDNDESFIGDVIVDYNAGSGDYYYTIDMADEVKGDYTATNKSLKAQLIDKMAVLSLQSLIFDKLNALIKAFLNKDAETTGLLKLSGDKKRELGLLTDNGDGTTSPITFYDYQYYTEDSINAVKDLLGMYQDGVTHTAYTLISTDLYNNTVNKAEFAYSYPFNGEAGSTDRGTIYTNSTQEEIDRAVVALAARISALTIKDAETEDLKILAAQAWEIAQEDYDTESDAGKAAWDTFVEALAATEKYVGTKENPIDKTEYDIFEQTNIETVYENLDTAIKNLVVSRPPKMEILTTAESMQAYYNITEVAGLDGLTTGALPDTGTFILPVKAGYSMVVYTNELNPRILINLEAFAPSSTPLSTKPEKMIITAKRTTGAQADIITGTQYMTGENKDKFAVQDVKLTENVNSTKIKVQTYEPTLEADNNASLFAILTPKFAAGDKLTQSQAVMYTIQASDNMSKKQGLSDNHVAKFTFDNNGAEAKLPTTGEGKNEKPEEDITIYVYYRNTMPAADAEGNVNDEGIIYSADNVLTDTVGSFVTNNIEGKKGTWQNVFGLQRSFPNIKAWELVDENNNGYVNWVYPNNQGIDSSKDEYKDSLADGPIYNDPSFGQMNTGSFAYVLDDKKAIDADVINKYNSVKTANGTEATDMDYEAATAAKNLLLDTMTSEHFKEIKKYKSFVRYGSYQYWSQNIIGNCKRDDPENCNHEECNLENGDLVFVHVVDRWGNVCNRIMQVSDYDGKAPEVNSDGAGAATIAEQGGSGLETVGIWTNGEQTAPVQTNSAAITLNGTESTEVEQGTELVFAEGITVKENSDVTVYENADGVTVAQVSGNSFTVDGLVPGKEYQVGACDTAGNVTAPKVLADANGNVEITVLEDEEATFTLNSDIVVTINTGISSSVIDAEVEGNVLANKYIDHIIVTKDNVTQIKVVNLADNKETVYKPASTIMYEYEDGTIGWETYYKLTEGQHSYKVYAMVDGEYEEMGVTYTFDATLKTVPLSLSVVGNGKIVLEYSGAAPANVSNFKLVNIPYGAKVTIKATSLDENSKFYYWQNDATNRVLNVNEEMSFTAVASVDYDAYFTNSLCLTSDYKYVVYVNNAGNVIKSVELRDGNTDYVVPLGPSLPDHEFKGWAMSKAEVIASEEDIVVVRPIYTLNAEYTVELTEGNYTVSGAGTYTAADNQRPLVTINASATNDAGEDFLYWIDEETKDIVSYDRAYAFNLIKNVVLTPVYGDGSSLVAEPVVRIADVRYDASSGKASFYSQRSIGEDYVLYETGILVTRTQSIAENEDSFILGGVSTAKGTSTSTAPYGTYSVNVAVSAQETVWARAYAIVETADGEIIEVYGDIVPYTNK